MKHWITTHWPQLAEDTGDIPSGVHLQEGTQQAGSGIDPGDMITYNIIYTFPQK